jgi:hypothetical protein
VPFAPRLARPLSSEDLIVRAVRPAADGDSTGSARHYNARTGSNRSRFQRRWISHASTLPSCSIFGPIKASSASTSSESSS